MDKINMSCMHGMHLLYYSLSCLSNLLHLIKQQMNHCYLIHKYLKTNMQIRSKKYITDLLYYIIHKALFYYYVRIKYR
jgi:hypothetical protein